MKEEKFRKYIIKGRLLKAVSGHKFLPGMEETLFLSNEIVRNAGLFIVGRVIKEVKSPEPPPTEPHSHDVDQIFVYLGDPGKLRVEVTLGDEKYEVTSPTAVFVPKGIKHAMRVINGSGAFLGILKKGTYS